MWLREPVTLVPGGQGSLHGFSPSPTHGHMVAFCSEGSVSRRQLSEESQRREPRALGQGGALSAFSLQVAPFFPQLLSLTLDGLTGVSQDHMRAHYQTGSNHMMLNINLWSTLLLGAGILFTGELWEFLSFAERHPAILYNILLFGLTSALGQSFIFMTVVYFGPLTCSIITTTRKFFTILASVILFANPISPMQWVGTVLVFLGLGLDAKFGKGAKKTSH
ncbi:solute carrier family 35 member B1 [Phyllostomus discolor]|uniref:Solute carrier family 35 member B1 n=1 Tax=Phyllostomus discolor TaxID=89673 RepID=A0A833ZQE5_9CHIR|nr:solute carrier family 35 member B1 [Phyllostomus discolor]